MARRYAQDTTVPIAKSRGQIDDVLREWGCDGIRWTDMFAEGRVLLEFLWKRDEASYLARIELGLPPDSELRAEAAHATTGHFLQAKYDRLAATRGRPEHRLLLLWLKAAFNAVDAGLVEAEVLFLPFFVGTDGRTVAQAALPRLPMLLANGSVALLGIAAEAH